MVNIGDSSIAAEQAGTFLGKLADDLSAGHGADEARLTMLRGIATALAGAAPAPGPAPESSGDLLRTLLPVALKPEEIEGPPAVRERRATELVRWFARHSQGHANSKWFDRHAYELAAYVARLKSL